MVTIESYEFSTHGFNNVLAIVFAQEGRSQEIRLRIESSGYPHSAGCSFYQGTVIGAQDSRAVINTCNGKLASGGISFTASDSLAFEKTEDGFNVVGNLNPKRNLVKRKSPQKLVYPHYYSKYTFPQLTVELMLVYDHSMYKLLGSDRSKVDAHAKELMNLVNWVYYPLNVRVALVHIDVMSKGEYFDIENKEGDVDMSLALKRFGTYVAEYFYDSHPVKFDNAQLISNRFGGGRAWVGGMCQKGNSFGVNGAYHSTLQLAGVVTHEMGHNLGFLHDDQYTKRKPTCCEFEYCIMHGSGDAINGQPYWSECNMENLRDRLYLLQCLRNAPESLQFGPICGNHILEAGEECDCGIPEACGTKCCDPLTCKLTSGSYCSNGECCDQNTCHVKKLGSVCRSKSGECDLDEFCDGAIEDCPPNYYRYDGEKCADRDKCAKGVCQVNYERTFTNCSAKCNGNGLCNNLGNCHCFPGYAPPECIYPGIGGSINSGDPGNIGKLNLTIAVITFLFIAIPLLTFLITWLNKKRPPCFSRIVKSLKTVTKPNKPPSSSQTILKHPKFREPGQAANGSAPQDVRFSVQPNFNWSPESNVKPLPKFGLNPVTPRSNLPALPENIRFSIPQVPPPSQNPPNPVPDTHNAVLGGRLPNFQLPPVDLPEVDGEAFVPQRKAPSPPKHEVTQHQQHATVASRSPGDSGNGISGFKHNLNAPNARPIDIETPLPVRPAPGRPEEPEVETTRAKSVKEVAKMMENGDKPKPVVPRSSNNTFPGQLSDQKSGKPGTTPKPAHAQPPAKPGRLHDSVAEEVSSQPKPGKNSSVTSPTRVLPTKSVAAKTGPNFPESADLPKPSPASLKPIPVPPKPVACLPKFEPPPCKPSPAVHTASPGSPDPERALPKPVANALNPKPVLPKTGPTQSKPGPSLSKSGPIPNKPGPISPKPKPGPDLPKPKVISPKPVQGLPKAGAQTGQPFGQDIQKSGLMKNVSGPKLAQNRDAGDSSENGNLTQKSSKVSAIASKFENV